MRWSVIEQEETSELTGWAEEEIHPYLKDSLKKVFILFLRLLVSLSTGLTQQVMGVEEHYAGS